MTAPAVEQHTITCPGDTCRGECNPPPRFTRAVLRVVSHYEVDTIPEEAQGSPEAAVQYAATLLGAMPRDVMDSYLIDHAADSETWTALEGP